MTMDTTIWGLMVIHVDFVGFNKDFQITNFMKFDIRKSLDWCTGKS